jgi:integrase
MSVPLPQPIAGSPPEIHISTGSNWSDRVWQLDVTLPGTVRSDVALDWAFALPDGSRFTDAQWISWRDAAKGFLWTLRVDPPAGHRRARDSSLVRRFQHLRVLIRWMAGEGYRRFADLDRDAAERFLSAVKARPGRKGDALSGATLAGYASLLNILCLQRDRLPDAPGEDLLAADRLRLLAGGSRQRRGSLPCTPDAVAVPLVCAAIRLLGGPADDIIALRDRAKAAVDDATARRLDRGATDACIEAALAGFIFSTPAGETQPWRTKPVADLAAVQFFVSRLYDACFVVIAYLVGARVSEILGLEVGCIVDHPSADGIEAFAYLTGRIYKTADGPGGRPHRWVATAPVARAIAVLERLSEPVRRLLGRDELWLMPSRDGGFHIHRSANLIDHLNGPFAAFIDLPANNGRPWHLTPHQGRKTFARFVGRRDRTGLHALAAHFGHVTRVMTDASYVGTDFELGDLIDAEMLDDTRAALEQLLTASGLAGKAGRAIAAGSRFRGRTRDGDVKEYVDFILRETDMRLGTCDWGYCVYRRESSACLGDDRGPNPVLRTQSTCAGCANFAVTEKHRPVWAARRRRNADLLLHPALDPESRALAAARVEECDRILADLDQNRSQHGA